jgi:hypothetical protein
MASAFAVMASSASTAFAGLGPYIGHHQVATARRVPASMKVESVESTPNPSAFLLRLDVLLEGVSSNTLRGETFRKGLCPPSMAAALDIDGVASIFAVGQLLTISKSSGASWEAVLPPVVEALGGAGDALAASGSLLPSAGATSVASGGVAIRLQMSQKLPIQVEASGWSGAYPPLRAKLPARFGSAMALLIEQSGDSFFKGRAWLPRGLRYPELDESDADAGADGPATPEQRAIAAALEAELAEVEAAYPDDRLAALVYGSKARAREKLLREEAEADSSALLSLEAVDRLCDATAHTVHALPLQSCTLLTVACALCACRCDEDAACEADGQVGGWPSSP